MTGLDCFREELKKQGCNSSQVNSKVVAIALDILSQSGNKYREEEQLEQEIEGLKREIQQLYSIKQMVADQVKLFNKQFACNVQEKYGEIIKYFKLFFEELDKCETKEAKDAMRTAQMFVNSVTVDTKYDNTAFIIGLASILSRGEVGAIKELKKINLKLPDVEIAKGRGNNYTLVHVNDKMEIEIKDKQYGRRYMSFDE